MICHMTSNFLNHTKPCLLNGVVKKARTFVGLRLAACYLLLFRPKRNYKPSPEASSCGSRTKAVLNSIQIQHYFIVLASKTSVTIFFILLNRLERQTVNPKSPSRSIVSLYRVIVQKRLTCHGSLLIFYKVARPTCQLISFSFCTDFGDGNRCLWLDISLGSLNTFKHGNCEIYYY